jgi:sulfate adenylyltransferase subunit 2
MSVSAPGYLRRLESESIHIFREVIAECEKPVLLYSVGKDSSVLLHLARKAFAPAKLPFPLLHIASGWDFRELLEFRDATAKRLELELHVHRNEEGARAGMVPWNQGPAYVDTMLTRALRQALEHHKFDAAIGGGRRDEEKSRAKERIFSFRDSQHRWDPKSQRPELWSLYNARKNPGESIRVFPLSNWTELDVWQYIQAESIPVVPLYLAKPRPVVRRAQGLIMVDDERLPRLANESIETLSVRFRTLGDYPLTAAIESNALDVGAVILELHSAKTSERAGRLVDQGSASMEAKKREGYF